MKHAFRLKREDDLLLSIENYAKENHIEAATVSSSVGCLSHWTLRDAGGVKIRGKKEDVEILSLNGTVSSERTHLHICLAGRSLSAFGGHLVRGCVVNTTCEIVLEEIEDIKIASVFDDTTGYDELLFVKKEDSITNPKNKPHQISACGDDCSLCPRKNAKTWEELEKVNTLWQTAKWRENTHDLDRLRCGGCCESNPCTYGILPCQKEQKVKYCNQCNLYPCEKIDAMIDKSFKDEIRLKNLLSPEDFKTLKNAFFNKKENLDKQ